MARILLVGDLHVKTFLLPFIDRAIDDSKPDRVIVLGDYLDDWGVNSKTNLEGLMRILVWARGRGDVTLLLGNHDLAYFSRSGNCPGNNLSIQAPVHHLFEENLDIVRVADAEEDWLFTHAGLCSMWAQQYLDTPKNAAEAAEQINVLLCCQEGLTHLESVGRGRGGWQKPGPLWADWFELIGDPYPGINQIVGHTPTEACLNKTTSSGEQLWCCCDTFSTTNTGRHIGDGSVLLLDSGADEVSIVEQADSVGLDDAYEDYIN